MGVYADYNAVPLDIVDAHRSDFEALIELCESEDNPCWSFSIHKAWRFAWCVLEPDAFLVTSHPEDAPSQPAGPLGAAVVGTRPLNVEHSLERGEEFIGVLFHTRWADPDDVQRSAEALRQVTMADVKQSNASGAIERAFPRGNVAEPEVVWWAIEGLTEFYTRAASAGRAVVLRIG